MIGHWEKVKLGEICEIQRGGSPRPIDQFITESENGINWIKIGDVAEGAKYITSTKEKIRPEGAQRSRSVGVGDFLLTNSMSFGRPYILRTNGCIHDGWLVLRYDKNRVTEDYLYHVLSSNIVYSQFVKYAAGAVVKNLNSDIVRRVEIPLPPLPEQRRIAAILDKADALRAKRRETLICLEEFSQSLFLEMFGDPVTNPKGWPVVKLESFILDVTNGLTRRGSETEEGEHIVLRLRDIKAGSIDFSTPNRITLNDKERAKYQVARGELLFIRVNGNPDYVGRCALFDGHSEKIFFNDHVMRVRLKDGLTGGYLSHFLNRPEGKREVAKHRKTSAGQHTINQDGLGALTLPIPDESLQHRFLARLAALRKSAATQTSSLVELDMLFASAQRRAFQGEL